MRVGIAIALLAACHHHAGRTRDPSALANGRHEFVFGKKHHTLVYEVGGVAGAEVCATSSRVPIDEERWFTVVYFADTPRRREKYIPYLEAHLGVEELPDCADMIPNEPPPKKSKPEPPAPKYPTLPD